MNKLLFRTASNLAFLALVVAATIYNLLWAENIIRFLVWFFGITSILFTFAVGANKEECKKRLGSSGQYCPQWLDVIYDFTVIGLLASEGWFGLAVLYSFVLMNSAVVYSLRKEEQNKVEV